jgi:hypothetical protein
MESDFWQRFGFCEPKASCYHVLPTRLTHTECTFTREIHLDRRGQILQTGWIDAVEYRTRHCQDEKDQCAEQRSG